MQTNLLLATLLSILFFSCGCKGGLFTSEGRQHLKEWALKPAGAPTYQTPIESRKRTVYSRYVNDFKPPSRDQSYIQLITKKIDINKWQDYQILRDERPTYFDKYGIERYKYQGRPMHPTMTNRDPLTWSFPRTEIWGK